MTQEIVEAVREIERDKGIETGTLVAALEDALLAAYKKTPGASRHATVELDDVGDFRVFAIELPEDLEVRLLDEARERALDELERIEEETGEKNHTLLTDDDLDVDWSQVPEEQIKREDVTPDNFGRIAAQTAKQVILPADSRGRARDDVRRVHRPRQRGRDRHRPAGGRPQQRARRPRQGRGAAAALRAGRRRALRAGLADQGRDHRGADRHQGPAGDPLAPRPRADQDAVRARGARDRRRPRRRSAASPASPATARRSPSSRTPRASTRSAHASARAARASAWSSRSSAARRSTSSRGTPSLPASSRRRSRRRACARSTSTTRPRRRRSSSPTTSSRSRSARRA